MLRAVLSGAMTNAFAVHINTKTSLLRRHPTGRNMPFTP
jgi:hypothetical protein